ncbi:nickel ABC transporter ATP-binding protein NikE [Acetobacter oeni]|nr:ABC transporter ATP-binding protein [Acetobacter oeni]NHO19902.1 nickel ABC transporter ATP-binding protein NikE [Acetobacter oeni]
MPDPVLHVEDLSVSFATPRGHTVAVQNLSFTLKPGQVVALVGESGSGKSVTARSIIGLTGAGGHVSARRLSLGDDDLRDLPERRWRDIRGRRIGMVLQDALVALDPLRPVGREIAESLAVHRRGTAKERTRKVLELLEQVGIREPDLRARQRPDELSGGLRQRALIASAIAMSPSLLIADEPTTALDPTVQAQILDLFSSLRDRGTGLLLISHDLGFVAKLADEIIVLEHGKVVEQGPAARILTAPKHPYTITLLEADPSRHPARPVAPEPTGDSLLEARDLSFIRKGPDGVIRPIISDVTLTLRRGRTLGLIGESGSGKTTTSRIIAGLLQPDTGTVSFRGEPWVAAGAQPVPERMRRPRRRFMALIYQDPLSSFDPRWTVFDILSDALSAAGEPKANHTDRIGELLERVRLPCSIARRRPGGISGGQRQRVAIARAVAVKPDLLICDEPVSALDVSVQAQVLDLLEELQRDFGLACLFISHDMGVIRRMCDDVVVMQEGRIIEVGTAADVLIRPRHSFTQSLLTAATKLSASLPVVA